MANLQFLPQRFILINGVGTLALSLSGIPIQYRSSMKELEYLFDAQWKNGIIAHIVFNENEKTYCPTLPINWVSGINGDRVNPHSFLSIIKSWGK